MRTKIFWGIMVTLLVWYACSPQRPGQLLTKKQVDDILQLFSERRLDYHLYAKSVPSNKEIFIMVVREFSFEPEDALFSLRKIYPELYSSLFEKVTR
ncbi:MAG: hypothetical protein NZM25_03475 [Leptospiraceae bacterium]|nr:hypothetical protein [Leptospiraceae bacterium]MDW8306045.1 hypothetical protein [Leptospiraceae bacterium]